MAMIALRVPTETARLMERISGVLPGDSQAASDMHITIAYLGDKTPMEQIAKAMLACHSVASKTAPFMLTVDSMDSFEPGDDGTPIILPVKSEELHSLEKAIKEELDRFGVGYSKKWPEFKPHVTMSYIKGMRAAGPLSVPISWGAFDMTIYGADRGDGRVSIVLPFILPNTHIKLQRIAAKIARPNR